MMEVMCVRDAAIESFGRPFFVPHVGQALREFTDEVRSTSSDSVVAKHPEDYDLYHLGTFDPKDGSFSVLDIPRRIAFGKDLVKIS